MKRTLNALALFFLLLATLQSCSSDTSNISGFTEAGGEFLSAQDAPPPPPTKSPSKVVRKLIKEGSMEFESDDLDATRARILAAMKRFGGYASTDDVNRSSHRLNHHMVIRVPAANFDSLMAAVGEGVEEFDFRQVVVRDVTEEYLDVETRLKTKKELERRYLELLDQAKTVSEILEIEREIGTLRTEIESIEGRMNFLQDRVAMSILDVNFYETYVISDSWADRFGEGFGNGWRNLIWFFVGLVNFWPFVLIIIGLFFLLRRLTRRRRQKND